MTSDASNVAFPKLVQDFFCQRLNAPRNASVRTLKSYRDAFWFLFRYVEQRL